MPPLPVSQVEVLSLHSEVLAEAVLYVAVEAVNDAPSVISPSQPIVLEEDSGPATIPGVYVTDPDAHETTPGTIEVYVSVVA